MSAASEQCGTRTDDRWWWIGDWWRVARPLIAGYRHEGRFWPLLLALVPAVVVIVGHFLGLQAISGGQARATYEPVSVPLTAVASLVFLVRAVVVRSRFYLLAAIQAAVFCCREIHFTGTHKGVYVATAAVVIWAIVWAWRHRKRLRPENVDWRQVSFLVAAVATYAVAIVIQRRAFKGIPGEQSMHIALEEATEMMAHLILLVSAFVGRWRGVSTPTTHELA